MTLRTFPLYLAVPVIAGVFLWYFARSTPDVRYSLSERIPVSFAHSDGEAAEVVQQLEVKNVGKLQAENVLVKIRGRVQGHFLNKHAETDVPKVTDGERSFEVHYPTLPPGGSFQLSFKSSGDGVAASDVSVSDSRGAARDTLTAAGASVASYVLWSLNALYLLLIFRNLRSLNIDVWKSGKWGKSVGHIVSATKPFYMSDKEWKRAVTDALKEALRNTFLTDRDLSKHPAYQLVQLDPPSAFANDAEWKACVELGLEVLKKAYMSDLNGAFTETQVLDLLKTQRPRDFSESQWAELEAIANKRYVEIRKREYLTEDVALKRMQEVKPSGIAADAWQVLVEHWQNGYYAARTRWVTGPEALRYLREARPQAVPAQLWGKLTESWETQYYAHAMDDLRAAKDASDYARGVDTSLLTLSHREAFERRVQSAIDGERAERRIRLVEGLLEDLLDGKDIPSEKPAELPNQRWETIRRTQTELVRLSRAEDVGRANAQKASELKTLESELKVKREKVDRQLRLIHDALTDPSAIDRFEDYDDTFAKGNLDNLKRLAQAAGQSFDDATKKDGGRARNLERTRRIDS